MLNFVKCYVGFLMLKESDIDTLENVKVGDRKRLITCQADLHKAEWSRSSLPSIDHAHRRAGLLLDTLSSTTMVANMSQHARFMRTNAAYLRSQLREHGARLLSAGSDAVAPWQLLDQVQAAARHTAAHDAPASDRAASCAAAGCVHHGRGALVLHVFLLFELRREPVSGSRQPLHGVLSFSFS